MRGNAWADDFEGDEPRPLPDEARVVLGSRETRRVRDDDVSGEDFAAAVRLLKLDPDDKDKQLVSVHVEDGLIVGTYQTVRRVRKDYL